MALSVRDWPGQGRAFVLLHGLSSNARTWDGVASTLNRAGHHVVAYDQRGHGKSDKPDSGYAFEDVTADLKALLTRLEIDRPVLAGQSWGGNVVLDFAARFPSAASGIALVDGGFIELSSRPGASWDRVSIELRPPDLDGMTRDQLEERLRGRYPHITAGWLEGVFGNFEISDDLRIRRRLSIANHMKILRAMWEQRPTALYPKISDPVLILLPREQTDADREWRRARAVGTALKSLKRARAVWFEDSVHDLHMQRPEELAVAMLSAVNDGFFT
ncbi:MAG: alpha/beta hydrolase [Chloroflexi bacterium]|nr:alpha/beta hydrolase [Chloroflexota bacterium]